MVMGTEAYMSPEQAKGKPMDRRTDIWAFGCVLYEMLTANQTFSGETITDTLAAVVRADPEWERLPNTTPVAVRELLQRCLQKDSKDRLRDIGEVRIAIKQMLSGSNTSIALAPSVSLQSGGKLRSALPWTLAALVFMVAAWTL